MHAFRPTKRVRFNFPSPTRWETPCGTDRKNIDEKIDADTVEILLDLQNNTEFSEEEKEEKSSKSPEKICHHCKTYSPIRMIYCKKCNKKFKKKH
ncbi:putative zf-DHHC domain containing protein [Aureococcus anophagefferens virus]|uniref:Putative zf-DHHC domain containing protein n=1 Tax=Aureococcus anophagefferens virus TaxID=1474867 RepID=A0A076FFV5_9VIRU|nr:putative zf-DHHC domain containing protein [Aureococcus anophagefferens virus]AII17164.1 putative zf-DHHC domain containing protein [Aureococcus anophagefferens virus]UOG94287.1 hypothetical protein MKD35_252 [Aureococcus anophagefferens virus]